MIKALIVDDDLNYAKYLLNIITTKFNRHGDGVFV